MSSRRQTGKINLLTLGAIVMVAMIGGSFFLAKEDPSNVGSQFMDALARHDVDRLTALSYVGKDDPAAVEAEKKRFHEAWDFCVNTAGQHFLFTWKISNSTIATDNHASVTVMVTKAGPAAYEEKYELPMEKENGKWVVDVGSISREMFPGLPNNY